jgi:hypothetical protein
MREIVAGGGPKAGIPARRTAIISSRSSELSESRKAAVVVNDYPVLVVADVAQSTTGDAG